MSEREQALRLSTKLITAVGFLGERRGPGGPLGFELRQRLFHPLAEGNEGFGVHFKPMPLVIDGEQGASCLRHVRCHGV